MKLVVAEKPSVARDLARVLGVRDRRDGVLTGNGFVITSCIGHLVELDEPTAYDPAWKRWSMNTLPMVPGAFKLRPAKRTMKAWRTVRDLLRRRDFESVINACDAGREGELIFRYVYERAGSRLPIERLWISSLTDEAIRDGFARLSPGRLYDNLADAARARSQADWLVGLNATRAMTIVSGRTGGVFSIGRVQTPTLALIVEREAAIRAFEPKDFWEVVANVGFDATYHSPKGLTRFAKEPDAKRLVARGASSLEVVRVDVRPVTERAPQLFDLTTLQRVANQRYGFSADRTLRAAQALYEKHKLISYPRTSSRYLNDDQRSTVMPLVKRFTSDPTYGAFASNLVQHPPQLGRRVVDSTKVGDHHAIIPTGRTKSNLPADDAKVFDLVVRRFLAALHPDARLENTTVLLADQPCTPPKRGDRDAMMAALSPPPDRFVARGRAVIDPGWHAVEPPRRTAPPLPKVRKGDQLAAKYASKQGRTKPPPRHTDASLLGAMETAGKTIEDDELREAMKACGLGTPATRASIIETLIRREYVKRDKKSLVPTDKGTQLIQRLPITTLKSAEMTGTWEARLGRIAEGHEKAAAFSADVVRLVHSVVDEMKRIERPAAAPAAPMGTCPRCQAAVVEQSSGFECRACPFAVPRYFAGRQMESSEIAELLRRGRTRKLRGFRSKKRKKFAAVLVVRDGEVRFDFADDSKPARTVEGIDVKCPGCEASGLIAGRRAWGCRHWRDGCRFTVPYVVEGRKLTRREVEDLVTKGKTRKAAFAAGKGRLHLEGDRYELRIDE